MEHTASHVPSADHSAEPLAQHVAKEPSAKKIESHATEHTNEHHPPTTEHTAAAEHEKEPASLPAKKSVRII